MREIWGKSREKKRAARKQQLLCLIEQRSEKKNSEFGIVCGMEYFERGGLAAVSWDLLTFPLFFFDNLEFGVKKSPIPL